MSPGPVAIVTGGASERGIGHATARLLASHGWSLVLADIDADALTARAAGLVDAARAMPLACDVTSKEQVGAVVAAADEEFGRVDALVNAAGISLPTPVLEIAEEEWDRVLAINSRGVFFFTQAVIPVMRRQGRGRIVNVSSVAGKRGGGLLGSSHYAASKAAVLGFTKAVAREVADAGITVNAVAPGLIATDMTEGRLTGAQLERALDLAPLRRWGTADEVAAAIAFLCSDDAGYITGEEIDINGGLHMD